MTDGSQNAACDPGTYSSGSQTSCTSCPAGSACPSTTQAVVDTCDAGTYSTGNQASCTPCPAGFACPNTDDNTMNACAAGKLLYKDDSIHTLNTYLRRTINE